MVQEIARSALKATGADIAFVEWIDRERDELEVIAVAGSDGPPTGVRAAYTGSIAERVIECKRLNSSEG